MALMGVIRSLIFSRGFRTLSILNARSRQPNRNKNSGSKWDDSLEIDDEFYDAIENLSNTLVTDTSRSVAESLTEDHKSARKRIKAQILYKKLLKGSPESSILSYRAREQISHLSLTDPSEWTSNAISEFFPISERGAHAFLRKQSKNPYRIFRSLDRVIRFDTEAIKLWLIIIETICMAQVTELVKSEESQIRQVLATQLPPGLRWTGMENVLSRLAYVDGNPNLPFPPQNSLDAYNFALSTHKPGYFQQIAETYYKPADTDEKSLSIRGQQELDLSIGGGIDDPSERTSNDHDKRHSIISRMDQQTTGQYLSVLPPIVTFSHQEIDPAVKAQEEKQIPKLRTQDQINPGVNQSQSPGNRGNPKDRRHVRPILSSSHSPPSTIAAFKPRNLQDYLNCPFRRKPFVCERGDSERSTSNQHLSRRKLLHTGGKSLILTISSMRSTCEECRKAYARSTDRAKCMVKDGQQRDSVEQVNL
ncbi:unnamed protein product [Rodentolepis nana]|uniref:DNA-directed DNA polymerase n=1 Tax=Rodentolepis nana TaxID=102285 RepID=A0A158QGJ1_RODNA|nr:unnamed protein product [Rodentolepis nana]